MNKWKNSVYLGFRTEIVLKLAFTALSSNVSLETAHLLGMSVDFF